MPHRLSPWTLMLVLVTVQALYPMRKEDPDPPKETPLEQHLKKFKQQKTRKTVAQLPAPQEEEETPLAAHHKNFFHCSTKPKHYQQLEAQPKAKTELEKKLEVVALCNAISTNDKPLVVDLLHDGVDPSAVNNVDHNTTLHLAAKLGHHEILEILLEHPLINKLANNRYQYPPIVYALTGNHPRCIGHLIEHRAWVGPDIHNYTCFHRAVEDNRLQAVLALLTYCIDPVLPIPEQQPVVLLPVNNDDQNQEEGELPLAEALATNSPLSLRSLCIKQIIETHLLAQKNLRCDMLSTLWGGPLAFPVPDELGQDFAEHMDFSSARTFVMTFSPSDHLRIACLLARHYAQEHLKNVNRLLAIVSSLGQTPLQIALVHPRPPIMQTCVDPLQYVPCLNVLLRTIPQLKDKLSAHPLQQNPYELFYWLFVYRLMGGETTFG